MTTMNKFVKEKDFSRKRDIYKIFPSSFYI